MAAERPSYVRDRPIESIRRADPWRPFAHYITVLPAAIRQAVPSLGLAPGDRVLDFGCADQPYGELFGSGIEVVGADLPGNDVARLHLDGDGRVPADDGSFDAVLSTQVLEHVSDPAAYLLECARLLRSGGRLLISTHGAFYLHPDPVDYWRWTSDGLKRVLEQAGFRILRFEGVFGMAATGLQYVLDALLPRLPRRLRPLTCRIWHAAIAFADRRQPAEDKRLNASVFVVVAEKLPPVDG